MECARQNGHCKTKQYLKESESLKVEIEELESLLGPDDTDVDFRRILEEARDEKGCVILETFSTDGPSELILGGQSFARGQAPQEPERTVTAKIRPLHQVQDSGKRVWKNSELDGAPWK